MKDVITTKKNNLQLVSLPYVPGRTRSGEKGGGEVDSYSSEGGGGKKTPQNCGKAKRMVSTGRGGEDFRKKKRLIEKKQQKKRKEKKRGGGEGVAVSYGKKGPARGICEKLGWREGFPIQTD